MTLRLFILALLSGLLSGACGESVDHAPAGGAGHGGTGAGGGGAGGGGGGTTAGGGGGGTTAGGVSAPVAIADLASALSAAVCDNLAACCQRGGFDFDADACRSSAMAVQSNYAKADPNKFAYDAAAAGECAAELNAELKSCVADQTAVALSADDCGRILVGKIAPGQPCSASTECEPVEGAVTACPASTAVCTVTLQPSHASAGDACAGDCGGAGAGVDCELGSADGDGSVAACYEADGLYCAMVGSSSAGSCAPLPATGATCESVCAAGNYCDADSNRCVAQLADGAACTSAVVCKGGGCYSGMCGAALVVNKSMCSKGFD